MSGWYDDGSAEEAEMQARLRRRQIEEAQENRQLEAEQQRVMELQHELRCEAAEEMYNALQAAEQILRRSPQISTNDSGKFRGVTTSSALIEVQSALKKADGQ